MENGKSSVPLAQCCTRGHFLWSIMDVELKSKDQVRSSTDFADLADFKSETGVPLAQVSMVNNGYLNIV